MTHIQVASTTCSFTEKEVQEVGRRNSRYIYTHKKTDCITICDHYVFSLVQDNSL